MTRSPKIGSCILLPLGDGRCAYVQFIGPGIYGDAVRVLPGTYDGPLEVEQVNELASGPEAYIAQTFVLNVLELPGARIVSTLETKKASELAPWWVSSPIPAEFENRRVISFDRDKRYKMTDFVREHPEIDPTSLPETAVSGEGALQNNIRAGWKPEYGNFTIWNRERQ